jgi:formylglycine-generating enzyme required for sulfatase activity
MMKNIQIIFIGMMEKNNVRKLIALAIIINLTLFTAHFAYGQAAAEQNMGTALKGQELFNWASSTLNDQQILSITVETISNTFDGSALSQFQAQDEVESGAKHNMWVSFGRVIPHGDNNWEAVGSNTHNGSGLFDKANARIGQGLGTPYLIIDIVTMPSGSSKRDFELRTMLQIRKFSSFDGKGKPVYVRSERTLKFSTGSMNDAVIPVLFSDPRETDEFNVHELFIRLGAKVLGQEAAKYGAISVAADIPGVDIFLDGGLVGRTAEKGSITLNNIRVGKHEVRIQDLSRRTAWEEVLVEKDRTTDISLKLLKLPSSPSQTDMIPIGKNPQGYEEYWRMKDNAVVVKVPAGEFLMGSAENAGRPSESPQRRIFVSEFLMDKTEVTWRQFRKYAESTRSPLPPPPPWGSPDDYPVSGILFNEAQAYCEWLGGRLPTEAEWEKSARGTDGREYLWGNAWNQDMCNTLDGGPHRLEAVGSYPDCLSPYGLLDMAGSLWEWCADWHAEGYPESLTRDPKGPETGSLRVMRGGSWISMSSFVRTAYRYKGDPSWRNVHNDSGFRCVQSMPPAIGRLNTEVETAPVETTKNALGDNLLTTNPVMKTRLVTMSFEAFANAIEGSRELKCSASKDVENGKQTEWWITVGEAKPNPQGGWEEVGNAIRCGEGSFEKSKAWAGSLPETPYLIAGITSMVAVTPDPIGTEKLLRVELSLTLRKLFGYSTTGEPQYEQSLDKRSIIFVDRGTMFLPLMMPDEKERKAFKLQEVLLRVQSALDCEEGRAVYGALSVSSDLDGAELLLDGGTIGRVPAGREFVLANILAGEHEVSARDARGRSVSRVVRVEQNRTAMVSLKVPDKGGNAVPYRLFPLGRNSFGFEEYRREMDEAVVVKIPKGEFLMGSRDTENQTLEHKVYVSTFLMDKTPVKWSQFKKFAGATGTSLPPNPPYWGIHDDHPAVFVTWEEGKAYCEWAGGRLPTEAEREKAARGTDGRKYPWGDENPNPQRAVFRGHWGNKATDPVGTHPSGASPYGLLDMAGNVWEFTADWYDPKYYGVSPQRDPKGPRTGQARVVRGGSWDSRPIVLMTASRNFAYRGYREGDFGFRCAMDTMD